MGQRVVGRAQEVLAVQPRLGPCLSGVDLQPALRVGGQVAAVARVRRETTDGLGVLATRHLSEMGQRLT